MLASETKTSGAAEWRTTLREFLGQIREALKAGDRTLRIAASLSALWLGGVIAYAAGFFGLFDGALLGPRAASALEIALFVFAALAPVTLFAYGAFLARKAEDIRAETAKLAAAVEALNANYAASPAVAHVETSSETLRDAVSAALGDERAALTSGLARLEKTMARAEAMLTELQGREAAATRAAKRTPGPKALADPEQPALPIEAEAPATEAAETGVAWEDVVRALNFPKDANDKEGFRALRLAVADREFAELLQAAEDILGLLAEDRVFMEDLRADIAPVSAWSRYVSGARGAEAAEIGGVKDEVALAITRGRSRKEPVFRDAALHFLRRYERLLARMTRELGDDPMVLEAADSRTGRAFMLVARATGMFD